ncbi:MAG: flavin reductase [Lachnospiraceae bacterium]|nr:flavin reductase [Lachnospiraceae bacterium]
MKRKSIGTRHEMPIQPAFIIGTYNEDGTPDFAPITWVSKTYEKDGNCLLIISMYGTKKTKQNTLRNRQLSVNMVSTSMLRLMDYFGQTSGKEGVKDALPYTYERSEYVNAPTLDQSPWVCECEVVNVVNTGESDTFFCRIKNVQVDETVDVDTKGIDLTAFDPVIYSGNYHSIGEFLGSIGDFYIISE